MRPLAVRLASFVALLPGPLHLHAQAVGRPAPQKYALLIGIDTYQPEGTVIRRPADAQPTGRFAGGVSFTNLAGPRYDVDNMRALLTSAKFGFPSDAAHMRVLLDDAATRQGIIDAMNTFLLDQRRSGDTVVLYISGHGSLRKNTKGEGRTFDLNGDGTDVAALDSTIVTADAYKGVDDITSRELRRIFNRAADKGVHLTAIFDTCHSGGQARGVGDPHMVPRTVPADTRDLAEAPDKLPDGSPVPAPEDRRDNPVLILSAAQQDQSALDVQDAKPPHGLFTNALIDVLQGLPATASAADVYKQVLVNVEHTPNTGDQQPALDASAARRRQPVFGGEAVTGPLRAAVVEVKGDKAVLDIGRVAGVAPGSTFVSWPERDDPVRLRLDDAISVARSSATITNPAHSKLKPGDIVRLDKWVHTANPYATFLLGPTNLSAAHIASTLAELRRLKLNLIDDPSSTRWTHLIFWDGSAWQLQPHNSTSVKGSADLKRPPATSLGASLKPDSLAELLPPDAAVWFDAPVSTELAANLLRDKDSGAQPAPDHRSALYIAASVPTPNGLAYAWYNRSAFDTEEQTPAGYGRGCSASSAYPLRTDWFEIPADPAKLPADAADYLNAYAARLVKLDGWLTLDSPDGPGDFPYSLAIRRVDDNALLKDGDSTFKAQRFNLVLTSSPDVVVHHARWVYVLGIDCQGRGELVWPSGGPGGKFPSADGGRLELTPLANSTFRVTPPFGTDTFILLSTSTPLPEPDVLNFDGAVKGGTRGAADPLASLLQSTSAARGFTGEAPTDWGVQLFQLHSSPAPHPQQKAR